MPSAANVSTGKPKVAGAVFRAPLSSTLTLPTDATKALPSDYIEQGYCSDSGMTNNFNISTGDIKAWGGKKVLTYVESEDDTFKFVLIESENVEVLKTVYGSKSVTGDIKTGVAVAVGSGDRESSSWAIDMIMNSGVIKRVVIPSGKVTAIDEIAYTDNGAVGYGITISCDSDVAGNYHYEYLVKA